MSLMVRLAELEKKVERLMLAGSGGMTNLAIGISELRNQIAALEARPACACQDKPRRSRKEA